MGSIAGATRTGPASSGRRPSRNARFGVIPVSTIGNAAGGLLVTIDGGGTWTRDGRDIGRSSVRVGKLELYGCVATPADGIAWVVVQNQGVLRTTDDRRTWTVQLPGNLR